MSLNSQNPLNMKPDPFDGKCFIFPETKCTDERRAFLKRCNEIIAFLYISCDALNKYRIEFESNTIPKLNLEQNTPMKFDLPNGECIITTPKKITSTTINGVDILTRQVFVMFYSSFETYLFQLLERSFTMIGITKDTLDKAREILMSKKWDGKFCKMNEIFNIGYKAKDLINYFNGFKMDFDGSKYENPLSFFDEIANIRHRIIHASSILENNNILFINIKNFHGMFAFLFRLTEYIDNLFVKRFSYDCKEINPGEA